MTPTDVRRAAAAMLETLQPRAGADWSVQAGDLDWDCRTTLGHVAHAIDRYALYLAGPATARLPFQMAHHPECSAADLLQITDLRAAALCQIAVAASPETRGFHVFGNPDPEGYIAMGCIEILVHTDDIARGLGTTFTPPADVTRAMLARLFPWAPTDTDSWATLQWATGRIDLPGHARVAPDWAWHASPLAEWDGTVKTRASYQK
ncbi:MAG: hypothetical protein ACKVVP_02375 [Chloroflexota bacterium]